jgi:hypothetical protein
MPRLIDLKAKLLRYEERLVTISVCEGDHATWRERGCPTKETTMMQERYVFVDSLAEAQGIQFECPRCCQSSGHRVAVTFDGRGVPGHLGSQARSGVPSRWSASGSGLHDLTLQPSIDISHSCGWHGWVTNGEAK